MVDLADLDRLLAVAERFGTAPLLLTADADGRPRAAAITVTREADVATVRAGRHSLANAQARPLVALLWPAPPGERFALLLDGEALDCTTDSVEGEARRAPGGVITIRITKAMLYPMHP